jgi:NAD(P)-dependent dehydrogenase (short-subunit alcohol dehydrogenase family)
MPNQKDPSRKPILSRFDLSNQIAIVTGGAGLLGSEFSTTLAEAGAKVVIVDKDGSSGSIIADSLCQSGLEAISIETDITDRRSIQEMVLKTIETFGSPNILVNSAALDPKFDPHQAKNSSFGSGAFEDYPIEAWNKALEVNLTGTFLCCQAVVKSMLEQGSGNIINMSSIYGVVAPDQRLYQREDQAQKYKPVYYSVTKAGILGLTRYLAAYYAGKNIRVNAISPGGVFNGHDEEFIQAYSTRAIIGRMAEKDEMNGALLFLASEASAYMTGANLIVDGGWTTW